MVTRKQLTLKYIPALSQEKPCYKKRVTFLKKMFNRVKPNVVMKKLVYLNPFPQKYNYFIINRTFGL